MPLLGHDRYCDEVVTQTDLLRDLLKGSDLSVTVPTCPDWTLAELVRHIGGHLRSVETAVRPRTAVDQPDTQGPAAEARVWALRRSTAFWARRAAHDLVIHRADAAVTVRADYTVAPEVAADAIDELLELISDPQVAGSSPRLAELRGPGDSIHLHATDTEAGLAAEWLIELGTDGFTWRHGHQKATVALRGPLADVLLVFYRRLPADSERVQVLGEAALLDFWLERVSLR